MNAPADNNDQDSGESQPKETPSEDPHSSPGDAGARPTSGPEVVEVDGESSTGRQSETPPSISSSSTIAQTEPYNHQKQQEIARRNIAYWLVGIVTTIILLSFIYIFILPLSADTKKYIENLILFLQIVFGPVITLTATAIGYYFGANSKEKE